MPSVQREGQRALRNLLWKLLDTVGVVNLLLVGVTVGSGSTIAKLVGANISWLYAVVPFALVISLLLYVIVAFVKASQNR